VSVVHGHSSHHAKAIEIANDRLVLYGCGDFLNDYEGIGGREEYRGDLALMYLVDLDASTGKLVSLAIVPFRIRCLSLEPASSAEVDWIGCRLDRESARFGTHIARAAANRLVASKPEPAGPELQGETLR
jgi:poly-gamma-glutamate synthesis protein (capsule biosynthesis protein)